jgi:hypothetical protein
MAVKFGWGLGGCPMYQGFILEKMKKYPQKNHCSNCIVIPKEPL